VFGIRTSPAFVLALVLLLVPAAARAQGGVVDQAVSFSVVNENGSSVPCPSDGRAYTLRGSLVGPASVLQARRPAVTLLVHGAMLPGDKLWRMRPGGDESFDFGLAMARLGHAVVSFELPGYGGTVGATGPDGNLVCQGSMADAIHQVVNHLRSGSYTFGGASGPAFDRVAIAGFSFGTQYTQVAAYSFGNVDAVVLMGWGDPFMPSLEGVRFTAASALGCFTGGEPKFDDGSGPGGYVKRLGDLAIEVQWFDSEPQAESQWIRSLERDPCGISTSFPGRLVADLNGLSRIRVPVLVADGDHDELIGWIGPRALFDRLTGTTDRTLMLFPGAGHSFFLERKRARWTTQIAGWLDERGL
jgi:pimeloyl-ACP methyl ester carboxylesterase